MVDSAKDESPASSWVRIVSLLALGIACFVVGWEAMLAAEESRWTLSQEIRAVREASSRISITSSRFESKVSPADGKALKSHLKMADDALSAMDRDRYGRSWLEYLSKEPLWVMMPWLIFGGLLFNTGWRALRARTIYKPGP